MCHVNGGDILVIILTLFFLLENNIITFLNCKVAWKRITLLANIQRQKQNSDYVWQEFKNKV
jgi:hypothetical protein